MVPSPKSLRTRRDPASAGSSGGCSSSDNDDVEGQPLLAHQAPSASSCDGGSSSHCSVLIQPPAQQRANAGGGRCSATAPGGQADACDLRTCRICLESEAPGEGSPSNPLVSPCMCSGGSRYVHRQCLAQWREAGHRSDAYYECEVCKFKYRFRRVWWAHLLGSRITLALLFLTTVAAAVMLLGFIPITGAGPGAGWATHASNGVACLALLGLLLSLALMTARACGAPGVLLMPDPLCPGLLCLDCPGSGMGWGPLVECGSVAECGLLLVALLVAVGFALACYYIFVVLWVGVQHLLEQAVQMVENVGEALLQQQAGRQGSADGAGATAPEASPEEVKSSSSVLGGGPASSPGASIGSPETSRLGQPRGWRREHAPLLADGSQRV